MAHYFFGVHLELVCVCVCCKLGKISKIGLKWVITNKLKENFGF